VKRKSYQQIGYDFIKLKRKEIKMEKQLAKISKAKLEIQERGMLNFLIYVDYEDCGSQGIGGICLDEYDKEKEERVGTAYGCEMIRRLLLELQVDDFSEMNGKHIWVHGEGSGLSFKPKGISALKSDNSKTKPVIFEEIANEFIR
jgi:hypothetical protein